MIRRCGGNCRVWSGIVYIIFILCVLFIFCTLNVVWLEWSIETSPIGFTCITFGFEAISIGSDDCARVRWIMNIKRQRKQLERIIVAGKQSKWWSWRKRYIIFGVDDLFFVFLTLRFIWLFRSQILSWFVEPRETAQSEKGSMLKMRFKDKRDRTRLISPGWMIRFHSYVLISL